MNTKEVLDTLNATPSIFAIVGTKIYRGSANQNAVAPYIVIKQISNPRGQMGTRFTRIQCTAYSSVYGQASQIADLIEGALKNVGGTFANYNENRFDVYNSDTNLHMIPVDGIFHYLQNSEWG